MNEQNTTQLQNVSFPRHAVLFSMRQSVHLWVKKGWPKNEWCFWESVLGIDFPRSTLNDAYGCTET